MSFFQKHIAVNRAIASLLILVCFVFPSTSFAWGYGPGTAPQPKILYLDDEKKFLDEFHAKKKDILFNDNLKWRETSEGSYVLDLPDTTNPMGEKIPVRFVMVPQKKETRFWNLYAQEKKNNQWEYKYKGSPLGYLENFESREPTFVSYLTSSNIQSALDKLKITYQENRSVEVAMTSEMIIENFPSAAAGVACEDLIAQQFDKDKYGMVATVYDALPKEMATKVREYKNYEGFKRGVAGTPNVNPNGSVLGPKKHTPFDDAKVELARIARDEAFKTSLAGTIAFQHRFYGKLDEQKWTNVLTNSTNVSEDTASNPKYQKLLQENLSKIIPLTQPTMTVDEKLKLIAEFNDLHKSINQSCQAAAVEYRKSEASTGTILHGEKPYTASDRQVMNFNQKNRDARAALEAKYKNQFTPQIKQLLATNQLGFLFGSEKFQERVGTFDAEDCFKSGNSGLKEGISLADVYVGQLESMKNNFAALDDRMEEYQSDQYMDILQRYVASYPLLMKNINSRLTSSNKDTQMLRLSCLAVDSIYEDEKLERFIDYGFMGVALIAGALTVGTGAAVVLSVMGGVTAVEATEAGLDWYGGYQLQMHGRKGLLSGNNTVNGALSVVDRGKALVTQAKWDFALTIVSYGVGDVLAEGYKASKASKALSPSKATTTEVVEQTATVEVKAVTKPEVKVIQLHPENTASAVENSPIYRVAGSGDAAISKTVKEASEFQTSKNLVHSNLGDQYQLVHVRDGDGVVINPEGKLQNIFIHDGQVHIESIVSSKKLGNVEISYLNGRIQKTLQLEEGLKFSFSTPPMSLRVSLPDGKLLPVKTDGTTSDLVSKFFETDQLQTLSVSEGLIIRVDDSLGLIRNDGSLLLGQRAGSEIRFFNQEIEVSVDAANRAILNVQNDVWGNAREWKAVGSADDISQYKIPKLTDEGIPNGYGNINCTGMSFSGDAWLGGKGPLSCALPDARFRSQFDGGVRAGEESGKTVSDLGLLPTDAPPNAAIFYGSPQEKFKNFQNMHERLMQMPEGGTALIYQIDLPSPLSGIDATQARLSGHVLNARKEGGKVVYYDFQKRQVSLEPEAIIQTPTMNFDLDIIETTGYHRGTLHETNIIESPSLIPNSTYDLKAFDERPLIKVVDEAGNKIANYEAKILENLKNGGRIEFNDGKIFNVKRVFSNDGSYNIILELDDGRLLRVPKTDLYPHGIEAYVNAHKKIAEKGVPLPQIYEVGAKFDYLVYEKVTNDLGIKNFKDYLMRKNQFTKEIQAKLEAEFLEFAKKTSPLTVIGDFKADQIVYSNTRGWVIVDVNSNVQFFDPKPIATTRFVNGAVVRLDPAEIRRLSNERTKTIFNGQFTSDIDNGFIDDINDAVRAERQARYP